MKIVTEGIPTELKFGKNRDLNYIIISSTNTTCDENYEITRTLLIRNGEIFESQCETKHVLVLSSSESNIPIMISFPGEYCLS